MRGPISVLFFVCVPASIDLTYLLVAIVADGCLDFKMNGGPCLAVRLYGSVYFAKNKPAKYIYTTIWATVHSAPVVWPSSRRHSLAITFPMVFSLHHAQLFVLRPGPAVPTVRTERPHRQRRREMPSPSPIRYSQNKLLFFHFVPPEINKCPVRYGCSHPLLTPLAPIPRRTKNSK